MFKNICTASRIKRFLKTHRAEYLVFKNRCTASRIKKNFKKHTRLNIFIKKNTQPAEKLERTRSTNDFHSLIFLGFFFSWAGGIRQNGGELGDDKEEDGSSWKNFTQRIVVFSCASSDFSFSKKKISSHCKSAKLKA